MFSIIALGYRPVSVDYILNKGDEISVRVVEVDRERGRIGLRLADDPDIAGKTKEELVSVGTGGTGGAPRRDRDRGGPRDRDPGPRGGGTAAAWTATPTAADAGPRARRASPDGARVGRPDRHGAHGLRAIRGARLLDRHGLVR